MSVRPDEGDPFYLRENIVSAMECTGLMPALPTDPEQDEEEAALYAIHDQVSAERTDR